MEWFTVVGLVVVVVVVVAVFALAVEVEVSASGITVEGAREGEAAGAGCFFGLMLVAGVKVQCGSTSLPRAWEINPSLA